MCGLTTNNMADESEWCCICQAQHIILFFSAFGYGGIFMWLDSDNLTFLSSSYCHQCFWLMGKMWFGVVTFWH